jgi:hypothetical protein
MAQTVSTTDGIKYGFKLLGYFLVVGVIGGVIAAIGAGMVAASVETGRYSDPNFMGILAGALITLFGLAVVYAGILGTTYKVIADAVYLGNLTAKRDA